MVRYHIQHGYSEQRMIIIIPSRMERDSVSFDRVFQNAVQFKTYINLFLTFSIKYTYAI